MVPLPPLHTSLLRLFGAHLPRLCVVSLSLSMTTSNTQCTALETYSFLFHKMPNSHPHAQDVPALLALPSPAEVSSQALPGSTEGGRMGCAVQRAAGSVQNQLPGLPGGELQFSSTCVQSFVLLP